MRTTSLLVLALFILTSCGSSTAKKQEELDLKEKEISLREKELQLKEKEEALVASLNAKNKELSNVDNLIGYWVFPHNATINIEFTPNGRFVFNDYNSTSEKEEILTGTYMLSNGTLTLFYDDRPKQRFKFYHGEPGDDNYYIKKSGYYFVKGEEE